MKLKIANKLCYDVLCINTRFSNILDSKITTFYENRNRKIENRKTDRGQ